MRVHIRHRKRGYRRHFRQPPKGERPYRGKKVQTELIQSGEGGNAFWSEESQLGFHGFQQENPAEDTTMPSTSLKVRVLLRDCVLYPTIVQGKRAMRVLSLFDGIATGLHVLDRLGIQVEVYFSSETDQKAIAIQKWRHSERITHLGCVKGLTMERLRGLGRIDLLLGGSPCNDLSTANAHPRGLYGRESTGSLFFEYVRVKQTLQKDADTDNRPFYWLFENTFSMEKASKKDMSRALGSKPIMRCASKYLPMVRRRLFWGNVPGMGNPVRDEANTVPVLQDFLLPHRIAVVTCSPTITTKKHSQRKGPEKIWPVLEDGVPSAFFINELEILFGFPEGYTDGPYPAYSPRSMLLGKAWCVPVVMSFLKLMRALFKANSEAICNSWMNASKCERICCRRP